MRLRWPGGLRSQLAVVIALITAVVLGLSFVAVYRDTGSRLRDGIDEDLKAELLRWQQFRAGKDLSEPTDVERAARRYLSAQQYNPAARIFVFQVVGGRVVTNEPQVLRHEDHEQGEDGEDEHEDGAAAGEGVIEAPPGLASTTIHEAGEVRVLSSPIVQTGLRVGTIQIADPLSAVSAAQDSLRRTFAVVGALAMALAILAGVGIATLIARPLRRIAGVAAEVDAGDLSRRTGEGDAHGEVGVLARAFDRMLDSLQRSFARQRDFVSDASHELRTPLAVLRAQIELLDREEDERERHEATALVLRRLDEMDRLVADMLTLAGAEAGRLIEPQEIELDDFFEDLRRDLPLYGERDFRFDPVGGTLDADPDRLTQVLRNLIRNAVAHTAIDDRIEVTARGRGGDLLVTVADTGSGISPQHLPHIFERFFRADESRSRDSGGSGLGLPIARAIVEAHGGRIWADSEPGKGTKISFEVPGYTA